MSGIVTTVVTGYINCTMPWEMETTVRASTFSQLGSPASVRSHTSRGRGVGRRHAHARRQRRTSCDVIDPRRRVGLFVGSRCGAR